MKILEDKYLAVAQHTILTDNELNNVIYLCLKYTFGKIIPKLDNPKNKDIKLLIYEVHEDPIPANIIDTILSFVVKTFGSDSIGDRKNKLERHMMSLINNFMSQPYELRNDLGDDFESSDLITLH